jgi:hypothetical protein
MAEILAPISLGELIDKITILEIKFERVTDPEKRHNIRVELDALNLMYFPLQDRLLDNYHIQLRQVNEAIWELEDDIRRCIQQGDFDSKLFRNTAVSIPQTNDQRASIKKQINEQFASTIVEEKLYNEA